MLSHICVWYVLVVEEKKLFFLQKVKLFNCHQVYVFQRNTLLRIILLIYNDVQQGLRQSKDCLPYQVFRIERNRHDVGLGFFLNIFRSFLVVFPNCQCQSHYFVSALKTSMYTFLLERESTNIYFLLAFIFLFISSLLHQIAMSRKLYFFIPYFSPAFSQVSLQKMGEKTSKRILSLHFTSFLLYFFFYIFLFFLFFIFFPKKFIRLAGSPISRCIL